MRSYGRILILCLSASASCRKPPEPAPADFNSSLLSLWRAHASNDAEVETAATTFVEQMTSSMQLDADDVRERAFEQVGMSVSDLADFEHPDADPSRMLSIAVARQSNFSLQRHAPLQLMLDHTPFEPYSPEQYDRELLSGEECWEDEDCNTLTTFNEVTKENMLMKVPYRLYKDFRWFSGGYVGWSWMPESSYSESGGSSILQAYTTEVWVKNEEGTIRFTALWTESEVSVAASEQTLKATMMLGIEKNFEAADDFLAESD